MIDQGWDGEGQSDNHAREEIQFDERQAPNSSRLGRLLAFYGLMMLLGSGGALAWHAAPELPTFHLLTAWRTLAWQALADRAAALRLHVENEHLDSQKAAQVSQIEIEALRQQIGGFKQQIDGLKLAQAQMAETLAKQQLQLAAHEEHLKSQVTGGIDRSNVLSSDSRDPEFVPPLPRPRAARVHRPPRELVGAVNATALTTGH